MKKMSILNKLEKAGVIAVVRGKNKEEASKATMPSSKVGLQGLN